MTDADTTTLLPARLSALYPVPDELDPSGRADALATESRHLTVPAGTLAVRGQQALPVPFQRCSARPGHAGGIDRILRLVVGLALIALTLTGTIGVWGWLGVVLVGTAAFGFCPLPDEEVVTGSRRPALRSAR